jgi:endonuclease/exonuclease/phosphatase family metal-dependent hydrolase
MPTFDPGDPERSLREAGRLLPPRWQRAFAAGVPLLLWARGWSLRTWAWVLGGLLVIAAAAGVALLLAAPLLFPPAGGPVASEGPGSAGHPEEGAPPAAGAGEYLFCFWNAENFFDDRREERPTRADAPYDAWFADNPDVLARKLENLSKAVLRLNDGRGPDILALAEVESERAAELLRDALNQRLGGRAEPYRTALWKDPHGGRHIADALLTRLPVDRDRTRLHGGRMRILEAHVQANGHDLVVIASHWTSRVSDQEGEGRDKYADLIYGVYKAMYRSNPKVDFLVCGDFNDPPDDDSVTQHLHAVGDVRAVRDSTRDEPLLLNLFAPAFWGRPTLLRDPNVFPARDRDHPGTHFYRGKWMLFDQICVSPGLLDDEGWRCDPDSAQIVNDLTADSRGHPKRFGGEHDKTPLEARGYSDHFPVTVRLGVAGRER